MSNPSDHPWNVTPKEAVAIQKKLGAQVIQEDRFGRIQHVAGVDVAFAYFAAKAIFRRHPAVPFVLLLALASNVIGVVAIAPTYIVAADRAGGAAVLMAAAIGAAWWLRQRHVHEFWPYIWVAGGLSWLALYLEGGAELSADACARAQVEMMVALLRRQPVARAQVFLPFEFLESEQLAPFATETVGGR